MEFERNYRAEKTAQAFHLDGRDPKIKVRGVRGVPSSGKSVMCLQECFLWGVDQWAYKGVRRSRFGIFRATYPSINQTTLKTVLHWFPEEIWPVRRSAPMEQRIKFSLADGTKVDMEFLFMAIEDEEDEKKLKSLELTGAWMNEVFEMHPSLVSTVLERTGRYPPVENDSHGNRVPNTGPKRSGIWMDTNSPNDEHWYKKYEDNPPAGWKFFIQPAPLIRVQTSNEEGKLTTVGWKDNPEAENIANLGEGYDYYRKMIPGMSEGKIRVNIENQYASTFTGKAVYEEYWHEDCAEEWDDYDRPIGGDVVVGIDTTGLNPGAVFVIVEDGGILQVDELVAEDMPFLTFRDAVLLPKIRTRFAEAKVLCVCDPANPRDSRVGITPVTDLRAVGVHAISAMTNTFKPRFEAVVHFLERRRGYRVTKNCNVTITGFQGGYRYRKLETQGNVTAYSTEPVKDKYSTAHDALQYASLYLRRGPDADSQRDRGTQLQRKINLHNRRPRRWA